MTILDEIIKVNELIEKGYCYKKDEVKKIYRKVTLENKIVKCDGMEYGESFNTIEKLLDRLSDISRRTCYIQEILKSIGINVLDLETNYQLLSQTITRLIFLKYVDDVYTYIEFLSDHDMEYGESLRVYKLNLKTNTLIFDRVELRELKFYHKESEISKYTLNRIKNNWIKKGYYSHNDLFDVYPAIPGETPFDIPRISMEIYGDYAGDIDYESLDKNICSIERHEILGKVYTPNNPRIFFK